MNKRISNASSPAFGEQEACRSISDILESRTVASLKVNTEAFLRRVESADDIHGWMIRNRFYDAVKERDAAYQCKTPDLPYNAVIIPPELAPAAMIPAFVPLAGNHFDFVDGLNRLIRRCDDLADPIYPAITETEIHAVLSAAQRVFGIIGIIAPNHPLRIYRFDCSHKRNNSECAVMNGDSRQSVIFLYHPRQNETYDRVFIFAHELGHALHFALTGDINVFPAGFDSFNDKLGTKFNTPEAKQEGFADAAAIAILGSPNSRLKLHLPTQFCKDISPMFVRYFKSLCNAV